MDISLVCPLYKNDPRHLKTAIESFLSQEGDEEKELIIVVDPPFEGMKDVLDSFKDEPSVHVLYNDDHLGLSPSRKKAIDASTGKYIGFLDGDDYLDPSFCRKMIKALEDNDADIVDCSFYRVDAKERKAKNVLRIKNGVFTGIEACDQLIGDTNLRGFLWCKVFKRETLISTLDIIDVPAEQAFEDFPINYVAMSRSNKVVLIKDMIYHYRKAGGNSFTYQKRSDRAAQRLSSFALARHFADTLGNEKLIRHFKKHFCRMRLMLDFDISLSKKAGLDKAEIKKLRSQMKLIKRNERLPIEGMIWSPSIAKAYR